MVAIGDTAHPLARDKAGTLRLRVLSALALAPAALAAAWFGPPFLTLLVLVAAALMAWEWSRLCGRGGALAAIIIAAVALAVLAAAADRPRWGLAVAAAGSVLAGILDRRSGDAPLAAFGILWIAAPCIALLWLASDPRDGRATVLWMLALVWATDIAAYAVGRTVGGPRLAPRMSPNKTWSGLTGGVACAAGVGGAAALLLGAPLLSPLPLLSAALAFVAQTGDLAESMVKRHFGVKDSSGLIPGHGGLLDRLDGLLAVVPVVALLTLLGGGSVLAWR